MCAQLETQSHAPYFTTTLWYQNGAPGEAPETAYNIAGKLPENSRR